MLANVKLANVTLQIGKCQISKSRLANVRLANVELANDRTPKQARPRIKTGFVSQDMCLGQLFQLSPIMAVFHKIETVLQASWHSLTPLNSVFKTRVPANTRRSDRFDELD